MIPIYMLETFLQGIMMTFGNKNLFHAVGLETFFFLFS
jgi:hypothetical protein